jgi:hypothetical protein
VPGFHASSASQISELLLLLRRGYVTMVVRPSAPDTGHTDWDVTLPHASRSSVKKLLKQDLHRTVTQPVSLTVSPGGLHWNKTVNPRCGGYSANSLHRRHVAHLQSRIRNSRSAPLWSFLIRDFKIRPSVGQYQVYWYFNVESCFRVERGSPGVEPKFGDVDTHAN